MAFAVPVGHEGLSRQVFSKFRNLVVNNIIDVVTPTQFDAWKRNFASDEEQYLAAQLLSAAVIRTRRMNQSAYRQIVETILPALLREAGLWAFASVEAMEVEIARRVPSLSIRFMPVDGQQLDARPGNSADTILREFGIHARVGDGHFVRADDAAAWRNPPSLLVFLDDLLGTGTQFKNFAHRYGLANLPAITRCIYVPLLATQAGVRAVTGAYPNVSVRPVETLLDHSGFFSPAQPGIWARDNVNTVHDAKRFYSDLMRARGVSAEGQYSLELTVLLPDRPPNNTLKVYWSDGGQWIPLLRR